MTEHVTSILASFHYFRRIDVSRLVRQAKDLGVTVDFLADSGAFSAYTTGATITLKQYAAWLTSYAPVINAAITLDVIGDPAASGRNTLMLEDMVGNDVTVIPVYHVGSPWSELHRWCAGHKYVALGGGAVLQGRERAFMAWAVKAHRIAAEYGTRFHGLGMTRPPGPELLPWYSVDSSYWSSAQRNGTLGLFDMRTRQWLRVRVGTLQAIDKPNIARVLRSYGASPRAVAANGFGRVAIRGEQARSDRRWLAEAAAEAWMRYGDHLRDKHGTIPAPDGVRHDGPKMYLATGSESDFRLIVDIASRHTIGAIHAADANAAATGGAA